MILTFGLLSPDKGIEHVIDALPAILAAPPRDRLHRARRHASARQGAAGRDLPADAASSAPSGSASTRSMIFHDRFVSQDELTEFLVGRRHLHHAVSQAGADHLGHAGLRRRRRARRSSRRRTGTRASCSPTGAASSCRGAIRRRSRARSSTSSATTRSGSRCARAPPRTAASMLWPAVARRYVESFERARAEHAARLRTVFQAKTLASGRAALPEINLEHLRVHDRRHRHPAARHLQRPALRRRLLPRRQRAGAAADGALEDAGTEDAKPVRALASRYLAFVSHAFDVGQRALPELHVVLAAVDRGARLGRQPRPRAVGARHGRRPLGRSRDGRASAGELFHAALPAVDRVHQPARLGLRAARHRRVPARVPGRQQRRSRCAASSRERLLGLFRAARADPSGRGSRTASPTATRACRRRSSCPGAGWSDEEMIDGRPALARLAGVDAAFRRTATSRRSAPTASTAAAEPKAAFDQQPVEACAMVSACLEARAAATGDRRWAEHARRAFNWFLGQNQLQQCALRRDHRRLPRRPARRSREREPGRRVDAVVPARALRDARGRSGGCLDRSRRRQFTA